MVSFAKALLMLLPGVLRVGPVRLPVYGVFAALGLVMALSLSQRCGERVGIAPEKLWDAGVFAAVAVFISSRVLLILFDLRDFVRFPLLMLALPSLSYGGILLTGVLVWAYLRWKRLPVLRVMDAWAPCGALLYAVLQAGHFVEGTAAGMPTRLPWGVRVAGDTVLGKVHPVQVYAAAVACGLGAWMYGRLRRERTPGNVASWALMLGGVASFALSMLRQPEESFGRGWLEPGQVVALVAASAGVGLWLWVGRRENVAGAAGEGMLVEVPAAEAAGGFEDAEGRV